VLDDFLGPVRIQPAAAVADERPAVAVDDGVEGRLVAGACELDEFLVAQCANVYRRPTRNRAHGTALIKSMAFRRP
jgi:hypothetical protein